MQRFIKEKICHSCQTFLEMGQDYPTTSKDYIYISHPSLHNYAISFYNTIENARIADRFGEALARNGPV